MLQKKISEFQKNCYSQYLSDLQKERLVPDKYIFPFGNPIRPVIPTKVHTNGIMLIGAFPSARFERINGLLVPMANNLSPFGEEEYFDGREIRVQESRKRLNEKYFSALNINPDRIWLTDIVKIYLFPEKHIKNCIKINPKLTFQNTHKLFKQIAKSSLPWLIREIEICNPKLILTLGEVATRILVGDNKTKNVELLNGTVVKREISSRIYNVTHLAHPEICRINKYWNDRNNKALQKLGKYILNNKLSS